jgi:ribosome-binding protein aMBF1 (putative translation factor)
MRNVYLRNREQAQVVAQRIADRMRQQGVSAATLAKSIPIQQVTLSNYFAGRIIPTETLAAIARQLQTTVAYLTAASDDPEIKTA